MPDRYPKRLIEVDLPIKRISAHARREKSIRHGHISTLHIWWARRPLAACRAVICASLWPDPVDELCPQEFRDKAARLITGFAKKAQKKELADHCSGESWGRWKVLAKEANKLDANNPKHLNNLRFALLDFIADFANWDNSVQQDYLETSQALTQAAHEAFGGEADSRPLVVDPFAGGGSIPLEALRVGADAFASDLNPIAVLLNKVVLEYMPKYGQQLADEVRKWGKWVKAEAKKELEEFYPCLPTGDSKNPEKAAKDKFHIYILRCFDGSLYIGVTDKLSHMINQHNNGLIDETKSRLPIDLLSFQEFDTREDAIASENKLKSSEGKVWLKNNFPQGIPIAYLWARTITCEGPNCGAKIPLIRQPVISKRKDTNSVVDFIDNGPNQMIGWQINEKYSVTGLKGLCKGFKVTCPRPKCGFQTPRKNVQAQLYKEKSGTKKSTLIAVLSQLDSGKRVYRLPSDLDKFALKNAEQKLIQYSAFVAAHSRADTNSLIPDESIPPKTAHRAVGSQLPLYGFKSWGDLFTNRQKLSLLILQKNVQKAYQEMLLSYDDKSLAYVILVLLAFAIDKQVDYSSSLCRWVPKGEFIAATLGGEKKLPMISDFVEGNPIGPGSGSWDKQIDWIARFIEREAMPSHISGTIVQGSANEPFLPSDFASAMITDPPYYDSVPYSDLSDFFYVWLRRTLAKEDIFSNVSLTPKKQEMTVNHPKNKDEMKRYSELLKQSFAVGRDVTSPSGIGVIVFAHKSTSGWEALLEAIVQSGWVVTASWPIDTERVVRMNALETASLGSSVHIVCRPRENPDGSLKENIGDWRDVLQQLPQRIHDWMPRLANEGVVGADAIFACLGPALEIFSRYSSVEKANGEEVSLKEYLEYVWGAVSKEALGMIFDDADTTGFEEDARLTAMWLWTLSTGETTSKSKTKNEPPEDSDKNIKSTGYTLEFDAARKIAQGLGAHLDKLTSLIEIKGDKARLLAVSERGAILFGKADLNAPASRKKKKQAQQLDIFAILSEEDESDQPQWTDPGVPTLGNTVLDRIHQSMILFAALKGDNPPLSNMYQ